MTLDTAIEKAYLEATRKSVAASVITTAKYEGLAALADNLQKEWQSEEGTDWNSLYRRVSIGTVTATDSFPLDASIRKIVRSSTDPVVLSDGNTSSYWTVVNPQALLQYDGVCTQRGGSLVFSSPFTATSSEFGYTITVPAYVYVSDLTSGTDVIQVDDPMWLVYSMAAEYVRNDKVRNDQYDSLRKRADKRMLAMKQNNGSQIEQMPVENEWTQDGVWL